MPGRIFKIIQNIGEVSWKMQILFMGYKDSSL